MPHSLLLLHYVCVFPYVPPNTPFNQMTEFLGTKIVPLQPSQSLHFLNVMQSLTASWQSCEPLKTRLTPLPSNAGSLNCVL